MTTQFRIVEIQIDTDQLDVTKNKENIDKVIGYLALWAIGSERYVNVRIYSDRHRELNAVYTNDEGKTTFVIGGVEGEDGSYSTHS